MSENVAECWTWCSVLRGYNFPRENKIVAVTKMAPTTEDFYLLMSLSKQYQKLVHIFSQLYFSIKFIKVAQVDVIG